MIRPIQKEDIPTIARLETACFASPWSETSLANLMTPPFGAFVFDDGEIKGYVSFIDNEEYYSIINLAVFENARRQGVGASLMSALEKHCKKTGAVRINLDVRESNVVAQHLYTKMHYQKVGVEKHAYQNPTEDGYMMSKDLATYILGMESSCDETSASVVKVDETGRHILSNIVASQIDTHRLYGGVVPEIASRAHVEAVSSITYQALEEAGLTLSDIDAVAVTTHPGLIGALLVGVNFAKSLAYANGLPLVSVNHIQGHISAAYLNHPTLKPPFLALVVSGGHTVFYDVKDGTTMIAVGGTRDDAAGEAFDKVGRVIGLPYPAGAGFDKLSREGDGKAVSLPSPALGGDNLDFSFSGIKTAALNYINGENQKGTDFNRADLAASYTRQIVSALTQKAEKAMVETGHRTLVLAGGVAANSHLRRSLTAMCEKNGYTLCMPELKLCGDNGAMIASAGYDLYRAGRFADIYLNASALDD